MWIAVVLAAAAELAVAPYLSREMAPGESFDAEMGWLVESISVDRRTELVYEHPVVVLPPVMVVGEVYTIRRRFALRIDGEVRVAGTHYFTAELLGAVSLPELDDCLKIRRSSVRIDDSGQQIGYDVTEWYARGVGVVRTQGRRFWKDGVPGVTRIEVAD